MPARCLLVVWAVSHAASVWAQAPDQVRFNRDIRPILSDTCFKCHGPAVRKSGLRLDLPQEAIKPAESGAVPIAPGSPDQSELIRRIESMDDALRMPPADSGKTLSREQRELLRKWVEQGANYEKHWSFAGPSDLLPPAITDEKGRILTNVDAFIGERLAREGLTMSPEADRETLIRRVAFALTGLPPTVEQVDEYLADASPQAYEAMLDRFLGSPAFGEEMARHWLDVARYGDTHGLHLDNERQMWAYRDWVIRAFNDNMPFDQFTIEQLAGDLLPGASLDQFVATGFIRCNVSTGEGGSITEEWVFRNAVDRTATMAEAWMGLTAGCSVCHDHKFDPLSSKDFYSLYAFFHSAADPALDGNVLLTQPTLKLVTPADQARLAELDARIAAQQAAIAEKLSTWNYVDPAANEPDTAPRPVEDLWFDDDFYEPGKVIASPGHPTLLVTAENGRVHRGQRALKRSDAGLAQDVLENAAPREIPADGQLFAHVWLETDDPPRTIMLQYFKNGWLHRAVWGDYQAIEWGTPGTTERVDMGALPETGKWVRLEVAASRVGLQPGDQITGFALTQFGGTLYWDSVGVSGLQSPASDPRHSLLAWRKQQFAQPATEIPDNIKDLVKSDPSLPLSVEQESLLRDYYLRHVCRESLAQIEPQVRELDAIRMERDAFEAGIPSTFIFRELDQPRESFVMQRGQYNQPGEKVEPGVPAFLPALAQNDPARRATRLDLARWLVSDEHPLTARVAVNRMWQQMFGVGLVKTSFDFGTQGELPSHPELLDWLASTFRQNGWNVKDLLRLMLRSATFRQASRVTDALRQRDPENRWLARGPRFRLDAEQIRDQAIFASGRMSRSMGGRGVNPYQPPNIWEPIAYVDSNTAHYQQDHGEALYRRSIYVFFKRTAPPPFMSNFDAPNRESFCARRDRTDTPLQALQLMNDVQHYEAARGLAERMLLVAGGTHAERISHGYRVVLSRRPASEELAIVQELLALELARYQQDPAAAGAAVRVGESPPNPSLNEAELAAYTLIANLLLNLDEALNRN